MKRHHDELLMDRALSNLPTYLDSIWSEESWDARTRRRILFALWDECAEGGSASLRAGGARARRIIEGFIRSRLPTGSPQGYTEAELIAFNHGRTSMQEFAPDHTPR
jgi:hypothetical protein